MIDPDHLETRFRSPGRRAAMEKAAAERRRRQRDEQIGRWLTAFGVVSLLVVSAFVLRLLVG